MPVDTVTRSVKRIVAEELHISDYFCRRAASVMVDRAASLAPRVYLRGREGESVLLNSTELGRIIDVLSSMKDELEAVGV